MENQKINKGNWIAIITADVIAIALMIIEGALGQHTSIFAIGAICQAWASMLYFCQYFLAKDLDQCLSVRYYALSALRVFDFL